MSEREPKTYAGRTEIHIENADMIICRCEEVTLGEILQAISEGAKTVNEIKRRTRAGMGLCQGRSCGRLVRKLIAEHAKQKFHHVKPATSRPPVRPLSLTTLASLEDDNNE